jgi:Fungal specific transcription factor domain
VEETNQAKIRSDKGWLVPSILSDEASLYGTLALTTFSLIAGEAMRTGDYSAIFRGTPELIAYKSSALRLLNQKLSDPVKRTEPSALWTVAQLLLLEVGLIE